MFYKKSIYIYILNALLLIIVAVLDDDDDVFSLGVMICYVIQSFVHSFIHSFICVLR